jgi:hypothetical protein
MVSSTSTGVRTSNLTLKYLGGKFHQTSGAENQLGEGGGRIIISSVIPKSHNKDPEYHHPAEEWNTMRKHAPPMLVFLCGWGLP